MAASEWRPEGGEAERLHGGEVWEWSLHILTRSLVVPSRWPWRTTERWPLSLFSGTLSSPASSCVPLSKLVTAPPQPLTPAPLVSLSVTHLSLSAHHPTAASD